MAPGILPLSTPIDLPLLRLFAAAETRVKDVPIWIFHGELDTSVPVVRGKEIFEALEKIGGNLKTTFYPGRGHDCWHETYNDPILYEWFLQHKKEDREK